MGGVRVLYTRPLESWNRYPEDIDRILKVLSWDLAMSYFKSTLDIDICTRRQINQEISAFVVCYFAGQNRQNKHPEIKHTRLARSRRCWDGGKNKGCAVKLNSVKQNPNSGQDIVKFWRSNRINHLTCMPWNNHEPPSSITNEVVNFSWRKLFDVRAF